MTNTIAALRENFPCTLLFVPANRTNNFERAWASDAGAIIFDLEDSVPPAQKQSAREKLVSMTVPDSWTRPTFVRLNSYGSEEFDLDMIAVTSMRAPIAGVMLPKVESARQVVAVDAEIAKAEQGATSLALILLIETPAGVMRVAELADCGVKRVVAFAFGAEDYRAGMRVRTLDRSLGDFARASVSNAAAAAGVRAIDAPLLQLDDVNLLREAALHACALGFQSKFAIHPDQISIIHDAMNVQMDRAAALRAAEAYERAVRQGQGSVKVDGRMIDEATMKSLREILKR